MKNSKVIKPVVPLPRRKVKPLPDFTPPDPNFKLSSMAGLLIDDEKLQKAYKSGLID